MLQVADTQKPMPRGRTRPIEPRLVRLLSVRTRAHPLVCVAGFVLYELQAGTLDTCLYCYTWVSSCSFSRCLTATAVSTRRYRHLNLSLSSPSGGVGGGDDGRRGATGWAGITWTFGFDASGCGSCGRCAKCGWGALQ